MPNINENRVLAPRKDSFSEFSQFLRTLKLLSFRCSRSVCYRPRFALNMAETEKRAITRSVPRHKSD